MGLIRSVFDTTPGETGNMLFKEWLYYSFVWQWKAGILLPCHRRLKPKTIPGFRTRKLMMEYWWNISVRLCFPGFVQPSELSSLPCHLSAQAPSRAEE